MKTKKITVLLLFLLPLSIVCLGQDDVAKLTAQLEELKEANKRLKQDIDDKEKAFLQSSELVASQKKTIEAHLETIADDAKRERNLQDISITKEIAVAARDKTIADLNLQLNKAQVELLRERNESTAQLESKQANLTKEINAKASAEKKLGDLFIKHIRTKREEKVLLDENKKQANENAGLTLTRDSLTKEIKNKEQAIADREKKILDLDQSTVIYKWSIMGVVGLMLLTVLYPLFTHYFRMKYPEDEQIMVDTEKDRFMKDTLEQYFYLKKSSALLRQCMISLIFVTTAFVIFLTTWNAFASAQLNFSELVNKNFWEMIGAISVPLGLVITLYSNAETKKNEISKFLIENKIDQKQNAELQPS